MNLIRYAGYDASEDDFKNAELAPLHDGDTSDIVYGKRIDALAKARTVRWTKRVDRARARVLRERGLGLREIGKQLALEVGRSVPFCYDTIYRAVRP